MDGKNLKFVGDILRDNFTEDRYGSIIPDPDVLQMGDIKSRIERQLRADTGLDRRMTEMYYRTDVEFTDNPHGNTPVLGFGHRDFGRRPLTRVRFHGREELLSGSPTARKRVFAKRQGKIRNYAQSVLDLCDSLKPDESNSKDYLLWLVERDQALTGGGFDGNAVGEVNLSALNFVIQSNTRPEYADTVLSKLVVEGSLWLKDHLQRNGMVLGSLGPDGASKVRFDQDSDGLIGFPVYSKGNAPLSKEIATRLLIETGVSVAEFVGTSVRDRNSGVSYKYRVIDALGYILDRLVLRPKDAPSIVTLLARIQKHGWKEENDELVAKPGKTRSVYPNAAIPGMIEAMIMSPFMREVKDKRMPFMPSLQNKQIRVEMITEMIKSAFSKDYDFLAADWSKYDATVKGAILATIMNLAVKPFFKAQYYPWVDFAIYALTYKYIVTDTNLISLHPDERQEAMNGGVYTNVGPFTIFGLTDGLISGAKFTHGGGSMYGEVVVHYVIPRYLNYEPMIGPQAGDDTLLAIPRRLIDINSVTNTYDPIAEVAHKIGLSMNASKQIWHVMDGEVVKIFLQECFHESTQIYGTGTIFRPYSALPFAEYDKGLSISEQMMAEIARMNGGADSPFASSVVVDWLQREQFLGALFKEHGVNAFDVIVQTIGQDAETIAQRIDVGSFSWGIGLDDLRSGALPILPLMAEAAANSSYRVTASKAIKTLQVEEGDSVIDNENEALSSEDEDILAD